MADTVDRILMRYQSQDFNKVIAEQNTLAKQYERTAKSQDRITTSATKLETRLGKLQSFGRNLRQAGGFLGNDTIAALGDFADGLSDVGDSINTITKSGGSLSKVFGGLLAVGGGITAGAGIYDATIGRLQGTSTNTILSQIKQLIDAGFNVETLRVQAYQAMIVSQNSQYGYTNKQQEISNRLIREGIITPQQGGMLGEGLANNIASLKEQQKKYQQILADLESGKMLEGPDMFLAKAQERLQAINDAIALVEQQMLEQSKKNPPVMLQHIQRAGTLFQAGQNLLQAGQALGQRQAGARNMYASAIYAIEQETGQRRAEIARSYAQSLIELDNQYYLARQQAAEQFGVEAARMEAEHQKEIRRMQEDHEDRLKKLGESRDALAIEDEIESYNKERSRAEEDYQDAARIRQEDYARQMQEMERAHQEQRAERQRAYQEQLRELNQQAQIRRQQEYVQYQLLLKQIIDAFIQARREFAEQVNTSNTVTNNNKTANVTNHINANMDTQKIKSAVNDAIVEAFR